MTAAFRTLPKGHVRQTDEGTYLHRDEPRLAVDLDDPDGGVELDVRTLEIECLAEG